MQEHNDRERGTARVYKTQLDAVAYLKDAGYKCSKSQFNRDVKARKVPRTPEGWFDETALLGYANANLKPAGQVADRQLADATTSRLSADAQLKRYQAERARLKLEKEQGLLMPRAEHERDLGARALFFRNEVRNFIHLHGATLIHLVGGDEGRCASWCSGGWRPRRSGWMPGAARGSLWSTKKTTARMRTRRVRRMREDPVL